MPPTYYVYAKKETGAKASSDYLRPSTPPLSRASTPASSSAPPTPTFASSVPDSPRMVAGRQVVFSSNNHTYRQPEYDEQSVMRAFSSHFSHCVQCSATLNDFHKGDVLCQRGTGYARDLGTYFWCCDGKPHSSIDRINGKQVQVEVPTAYTPVTRLFEALHLGLELKRHRSSRAEVHQRIPSNSSQTSTSTTSSSRRRDLLPEIVVPEKHFELRPSRTDSRRHRDSMHRSTSDRYLETRKPVEERWSEPRIITDRHFELPVADNYSTKTPRTDVNIETRIPDSKRGSLYHIDEKKKRRSTIVFPSNPLWP